LRSSLTTGIVLLAVLVLVLLPGCSGPEPPLNLVIVLVDTLRADHLQHHGYQRETSPRIAAEAARGQVFLRHFSTASRTGPSVASIFTGLFPRSHGVVNPLNKIDAKGLLVEAQTTLAEILALRDYRCYGYTANLNVGPRFGFAQGFIDYQLCRTGKAPELRERAGEVFDQAGEEPFFLYLHYMEPHSSYAAPPEYRQLFVDPDYAGIFDGSHQQLNDIVGNKLEPDAADGAHLEALYDQEIRYIDDEFGLLMDDLAARGLLDETLVVFIADHGEEFLEHGSALHGYTLYEDQLHVPFFVLDPRRPEPGRHETITRHVDVLPTLLDLLHIPYDGLVQGRSLVPLLDGDRDAVTGGEVLAEASLKAVKTVRKRSLRVGDWKLIEGLLKPRTLELYNLADDPGEQVDLLESRPDMAQKLRLHLDEMMADLPEAATVTTPLTDEERRKLRSLGYVK
jgi:arylsulfatase A-like enzyme